MKRVLSLLLESDRQASELIVNGHHAKPAEKSIKDIQITAAHILFLEGESAKLKAEVL